MEDLIDVEQCRAVFSSDNDGLLPPTLSKPTSVGYDLSSTTLTSLKPGDVCDFDTGFSYMGVCARHPVRDEELFIPQCIAVVESRSPLFDKHRVYVHHPKRIEVGERIVVTLTNGGTQTVKIHEGDRIAQLVMVKYPETHDHIALNIKEGVCMQGDCIPTDQESIPLDKTEWGRIEQHHSMKQRVFNRIVSRRYRGEVHVLEPVVNRIVAHKCPGVPSDIDKARPVAELAIRTAFRPGRVCVVRSDGSTREDYPAVNHM